MPGASRTINYQQLTIHSRSRGFTLIELLVVITLFGITSILITASYLTFERNQRIRNAAQTLKNDLRFAQNKALAGDKGANSECAVNSTLIGWYVTFNISSTTYTYVGACNASGTELPFNPKTVTYPSDVSVNAVKLNGVTQGGVITVLFKPLATDVALHSSSGPPFNSGNTVNFTGDLTIELKGSQTANVNTVTVRSTGEISGN